MNAMDGAVLAGLFGVWLGFVYATVRAMLRPLDSDIPEVKVSR